MTRVRCRAVCKIHVNRLSKRLQWFLRKVNYVAKLHLRFAVQMKLICRLQKLLCEVLRTDAVVSISKTYGAQIKIYCDAWQILLTVFYGRDIIKTSKDKNIINSLGRGETPHR